MPLSNFKLSGSHVGQACKFYDEKLVFMTEIS